MPLTDGLQVCANIRFMQTLLVGVACNILLSSFKHHIKKKTNITPRPVHCRIQCIRGDVDFVCRCTSHTTAIVM